MQISLQSFGNTTKLPSPWLFIVFAKICSLFQQISTMWEKNSSVFSEVHFHYKIDHSRFFRCLCIYLFQWLVFGYNFPSIKVLSTNWSWKIDWSYCFPQYFVPMVNLFSLLKAHTLLLTWPYLLLASISFSCPAAQDRVTLLPRISIQYFLLHRQDTSDFLLIKLNRL